MREAIDRSKQFKSREIILEAKYEDIFTEDNLRIAQSARFVADALETAVEKGWVTTDEAKRVFQRFCAEPMKGF